MLDGFDCNTSAVRARGCFRFANAEEVVVEADVTCAKLKEDRSLSLVEVSS